MIDKFVSVVIIWLISHMIGQYFRRKRFQQDYVDYLKQHEGTEFFCYTNRRNSRSFVEEHILPALAPNIRVIYLEGREPISQYNKRYISRALYSIRQKGFPNVMKIKDGRVVDRSLHNELYNVINQKKNPNDFLEALHEKLEKLRTLA